MKSNSSIRRTFGSFRAPGLVLALLAVAGLPASAAIINFKPAVTCAGDTDVLALGQGLFAYNNSPQGTTINGVAFTTATGQTSTIGGGNVTLAGFTTSLPRNFAGTAAPYTSLSAAYTNLVCGGVYNSTVAAGKVGTVTLNNLIPGHDYALQLWANSSGANSLTETIYDGVGGATNTLSLNTTGVGGGLGQFIVGTFIADSSSQNFTLDEGAASSGFLPLMNSLQVRDVSSVWSGTTSGNWADSDTTSANFSGLNYSTVLGFGLTNVYFGDTDGAGNAVARNTVTVGTGGASGLNVVFQNKAVAYQLNCADANGITGGVNVTLNGTNTVVFTGAHSYNGNTVLGSNARLAIGTAGSIANSVSVSLGANSSLIVSNSSALSGAATISLGAGSVLDASSTSLSLGSSQTLSGLGTVKGNVTAASGATLVPGGAGTPGVLSFNNNLTLNGQPLAFDIGYGPASAGDKIAVAGTLTLNGNSVISLNYLGGALYGGTYTLLTFASKTGGTFTLDQSYPGVTFNVNATSVTLTVAGVTGGTSGVWTNLASGNWTTAANWQGGVIATNVDALADFSSLLMTANTSVTVASTNITVGHMIFGDIGQAFNWTLTGGTNTLAVSSGSPRLVTYPGQNTTLSASLRGTQGFTKSGAGTLTLSGANKITGAVVVSGGTLVANSAGALGGYTDSTVTPITVSNAILTLNTANKFTNNLILPVGTSNTLNMVNNSFLYGSASGPVSGGGTVGISLAGGVTPKINGGANHNFTGSMIINAAGTGGMLFAFDDSPSFPGFGYAGSSNAVYELDGSGSSLYYMATSDWVSGGTGGATNYLGELRGTASLYANNGRSGTTTLEIGGRNTDSTFSGTMSDNHLGASPYTPMVIRKVGTGHLTLSGTSTYTGATDVRSGTLTISGSIGNTPVNIASGSTFEVAGSIGSATVNVQSGGRFLAGSAYLGSAAITLNGLMDTAAGGSGFNLGSATLSGSGVITGSVTVASYVNPGPIGSAGTLTITNGNFTAQPGIIEFDISSTNSPASGNDFLAVNGNLDFSSPGVTISINRIEGLIGGGTYVLAKCSGTLTGSVGNLTLVGANTADYLQFDGNQLELVVAPVTGLTWTGDGSANLWDISTSANWLNALVPSVFTNNCAAIFNATGSTNPVVNIPATITPAVVLVGATNYTFTGAADITGGASLIKNDSSTLTILNTNTFTGAVFVRGGTLAVGNAGTNGQLSSKIVVNSGTSLVFNTPLDQVMSNIMSGAGSFTKLGAGMLTLTANSALTGPTLISAGTLALGDGSAMNGSVGTGSVTNNGLLAFNEVSAITISNSIAGTGGIVNQSASAVTLAGPISGTCKLTNGSSASVLTLAANNSYSGGTDISGGTVVLQSFSGFGTGNVLIDDSGGGAIFMVPTSNTNVISNNIKLPQAGAPQFVATNVSLTTMGTVRLTGVISGGLAGTDTPIVNGGGTPTGNPRLTLVLANAANSFTMTPDVSSGCLAFTSDGALGNVNNGIIVSAGANFPGSGFADAINAVGLRFDSNNITLNSSRTINLVGNENVNVQTNNGIIAGPVTGSGLVKLGSGTLTLNGAGSLTNATTVSAGTLVVNNVWTGTSVTVSSGATLSGGGTVNAAVQISSGGTLAPGIASTAILAVTSNLLFNAGSTAHMNVSAGTVTSDRVAGIGALTYGGTLVVTNLVGTFAVGQSYQLFSAASYAGSFTATNLPALSGLAWNWNPANGTLAVVSGVATNPTNITSTVSGGNLNLAWPADHTGWRLQVQTNLANTGLGTNWYTWPGSTSVNAVSIPINPANADVFFRLVYP